MIDDALGLYAKRAGDEDVLRTLGAKPQPNRERERRLGELRF